MCKEIVLDCDLLPDVQIQLILLKILTLNKIKPGFRFSIAVTYVIVASNFCLNSNHSSRSDDKIKTGKTNDKTFRENSVKNLLLIATKLSLK